MLSSPRQDQPFLEVAVPSLDGSTPATREAKRFFKKDARNRNRQISVSPRYG